MKKKKICIYVIITLIFMNTYITVHAEPLNVTDCLEDEEDCSELNQSPPEEINSDDSNSQVSSMESSSLVFNIVKVVFALFLILLLIYVLLKFLNKKNKMFHKVKALENIGGISLGQNKSIQVVRIGERFYLIGVGDNVELLQEITDESLINHLLDSQESTSEASSMLKTLFPLKESKENDENIEEKQFKNLFTSELNKLKENRKKLIEKHQKKEDKYE